MLATTYIADGCGIEEPDKERPAMIQVAIDPQDICPSLDAVTRYLGGANYRLPQKRQPRVVAGIEAVVHLVTPMAAYRVVSTNQIRKEFHTVRKSAEGLESRFDLGKGTAPYVAIYLATLGIAIDTAFRSMADQNKFYQALLIDAVGTAMLDIMGARMEALVDAESRRMGFFPGCRVGPGLNGVALENQALLFNLLDDGALGVRLNEAFVMEPTKTISAFIHFDVEEKRRDKGNKCSQCKMKNCQFRTNHH